MANDTKRNDHLLLVIEAFKVEGLTYAVRVSPQNVKGPYNSDPIAFVPVKE